VQDSNVIRDELRREAATRRNNLTAPEVNELSHRIIQKLKDLSAFKTAQSVMAFAPIRNEVNLLPLIEEMHINNKIILLPRVEPDGIMEAIEFKGWHNVKAGPFGIKEPLGNPYNPSDIDVVIAPGLVFDYRGYRLGYGKGYYDRFLPRLGSHSFICGVCYEFQVVPDSYPSEQDVPVHWVVTEKSELSINWDFF